MPNVMVYSFDDLDGHLEYRPPIISGHLDYNLNAIDRLYQRRKEWNKLLEEHLSTQKYFISEKRFDLAKEMKEYVRDAQKLIKANQIVIDWFDKTIDLQFKYFPLELVIELDLEFGAYYLKHAEERS